MRLKVFAQIRWILRRALSVTHAITLGACVVSFSCAVQAQKYPQRPVRIIAPVQPGGAVDLLARTVAERLARATGGSFIVENQSGGGGTIAAQAVARAPADGYTLMLGYVATHGTGPAVRRLPYDAVRDFTAIAMLGGTPNVLVVPSSLGVNDVRGLLELSRRAGTRLSYGSSGSGSLTHLAMEQFRQAAQFDAVHVPYRGIGPAIADLLGGQTQMLMPGLAGALAHLRAGKLRALAITGARRHPFITDVPTFAELGYRGFDGVQWYGIVGPARLPAELTRQLNAEINKALSSTELRERFAHEAIEPMPMSPEQFGRFIEADILRWSTLARERGIELND